MSTTPDTPSSSAARRDDRPLCILNRCGRKQGIGTWCDVAGRDKPQPVCEEHWQALRKVAMKNG